MTLSLRQYLDAERLDETSVFAGDPSAPRKCAALQCFCFCCCCCCCAENEALLVLRANNLLLETHGPNDQYAFLLRHSLSDLKTPTERHRVRCDAV